MEDHTLKATSVRLSHKVLDQIREVAATTGISRSEIIRRGVSLVWEANKTEADGIRLALVDTKDNAGPAHFRVTGWIDAPTI